MPANGGHEKKMLSKILSKEECAPRTDMAC